MQKWNWAYHIQIVITSHDFHRIHKHTQWDWHISTYTFPFPFLFFRQKFVLIISLCTETFIESLLEQMSNFARKRRPNEERWEQGETPKQKTIKQNGKNRYSATDWLLWNLQKGETKKINKNYIISAINVSHTVSL